MWHERGKLTVWNLKAISGRSKSNQSIIFLFSRSGKITINELPMLRTIMSELWIRKNESINLWRNLVKRNRRVYFIPK